MPRLPSFELTLAILVCSNDVDSVETTGSALPNNLHSTIFGQVSGCKRNEDFGYVSILHLIYATFRSSYANRHLQMLKCQPLSVMQECNTSFVTQSKPLANLCFKPYVFV